MDVFVCVCMCGSDHRELSPLHLAVKLDKLDVAELLIKAGANVSKTAEVVELVVLPFSSLVWNVNTKQHTLAKNQPHRLSAPLCDWVLGLWRIDTIGLIGFVH